MLAIWIVYVVQDPVQSLTFLPQELFHAFGVFQLVPGTAWAALLTPTGLFALKSVLIGLFAWAMFGFRGARVAAAVALALVFVYLQVKKGFGGHWDHREMTLAYAHFLLLFTPAWDAFAVSRAARRPRREGVYRASLIALSLVVIIQYFFIGAARTFIGGPGIFLDGSLQNWIINRNLRPNPFGFDLGTAFLAEVWRAPLDLLFLGGTLLELVAFIVLFLRPGWLKIGFAIGFAVFHASIFLLMNVAFLENIVLILLFFDLAAPWRRARRGHNAPGVLLVDRARPAAVGAEDRLAQLLLVVDRDGAARCSGGGGCVRERAQCERCQRAERGERPRTFADLGRPRGGLVRRGWGCAVQPPRRLSAANIETSTKSTKNHPKAQKYLISQNLKTDFSCF